MPHNHRRRPSKTRGTRHRGEPATSGVFHSNGQPERAILARTLSAITEHARWDSPVRRQDLNAGDHILVTTRNSVYSIWVLEDNQFAVSGGWFDSHGLSPAKVRINGCTYGRSVIRHDVVAGSGLFLEFGNNVLTTRIQNVTLLRSPEPAVCH